MCEDIRCIYMPLAFKGLMGIKYLFIYKQNLNSFVYENLPLLSSLAINLVMILFAATQQDCESMTTPKCISMDRLAKQQSSQEICCKTIACYNIFF